MGVNIQICNVKKTYKNKIILDDCSYSFHENKTYLIYGPNGSGKTTLLRILALLEKPDDGDVAYFFKNFRLKKNLDLYRRITYVQTNVVAFNGTVYENISYGLKIRNFSKKEIENRVNNILHLFNLYEKANEDAKLLSSGEIRKLGLARAFVLQPEVLFLDEPTNNLDEKNLELIKNIIIEYKKNNGCIIVIATLDISFFENFSDEILTLKEGKLIKL